MAPPSQYNEWAGKGANLFRNTIYIGKIFGIPLRIHLSWLIIFVLITWSLGGSYYPQLHKGWPPYLYWVVGVIASFLFFASVLVHELAHSVLAKHRGLKVRDIVLFIFGGVSEIADESKTPGTEFLVALVGPLASIVLGLFFLLVGIAGSAVEPVAAVGRHLGIINLILAVFNLIPGFPLDGGRVLRAILWKITDSMDLATQWASRVGQVVAYFFILFGISWAFFTKQWLEGLWIGFIGWFLENAALSSYRQVLLRHSLEGRTVEEVMIADYPAVEPGLSVSSVVRDYVLPMGVRSLPVIADDRLAGLVTIHGINRLPRDRWESTPVRDVMIPVEQLKTAEAGDNLWNAMVRMTGDDINQLPVVSEGRLEGLLTRERILMFLRTRAELGL